jgi:hypothetical protein
MKYHEVPEDLYKFSSIVPLNSDQDGFWWSKKNKAALPSKTDPVPTEQDDVLKSEPVRMFADNVIPQVFEDRVCQPEAC